MTRFVSAMAVLLPLSTATHGSLPPRNDLCADFGAVLEAVPREFAPLRGGYDRTMEGYLSRLQIEPDPERENCWIDQADPRDPWEFYCLWDVVPPGVPAAEASSQALAGRLESCLESTGRRYLVQTPWRQRSPGSADTRSSRYLGGGSAVFLVQGLSDGPDVRLRVSASCTESLRRGVTKCSLHLTVAPEEVG